jgi:hypothetical protein
MRIVCLCTCMLVWACNKPVEPAAPATAPSSEPAAAPSQPTLPALHPSSAEPGTAPTAAGLSWTASKPFSPRTPKSSMRVAEYGVEGGDSSTELAVFFFGVDQGGSVEANMTRWIGQFKQPDGSETQAKRSERTVNAIAVSLVEAHGTYGGGMTMPGAPPSAAQPDAMLLGAIAQGPQGSVFFKLIGPRASVESARAAFEQLVGSLHGS